ncbi:MAG: hypothetical protein OXD29_03180 [Roseovarius sp.]|nr:hypothetical protein [Roseovarius sp.]MCY4206939.1 hypothetical protein [Roseovarius sp.]
MTSFQRDALQNFVDDGEKDHPPVFTGRQDILKHVLTKAARTSDRKSGIPGNTTVITGAPGAGKSSVLGEIDKRSSDENNVRVVHASESDVTKHIPKVLQAIAYAGIATSSGWSEALLKFGHKWSSYVPTVGGFGMSIDLKTLFTSNVPTDISDLATKCPSENWTSVIILAVDEIQRLPTDKDRDHAILLRNIHDASTGLPITLVLAGLGDTNSVIRSMGLTHGLSPYSLGCFSVEERHELTEEWCDHFHIKIGSCRSQIDALMAKTDGWPRHVHWAQQALAEALLVKGVDGHADKIADWNAVQLRSDTLRHGYYGAQYSEVMKYSSKLTAQVLYEAARADRTGVGLPISQVVDVVETYNGAEPGSAWRVPSEESSHSYVTHLIHCGALEENPETGGLTCPIPSFQNYILCRGGLDPAELEQNVE